MKDKVFGYEVLKQKTNNKDVTRTLVSLRKSIQYISSCLIFLRAVILVNKDFYYALQKYHWKIYAMSLEFLIFIFI